MAKYYCTKKCIFRNRLWKEGESLDSLKNEKVPKFFSLVAKEVKKVEKADPKTLAELQKKESEVKNGLDILE